jgi:multidrug resistance protein MdtO
MSQGVTNYPVNIESGKPGLLAILWNELKPFPGRDLAALRMAIACTAMVLITNTFRLPLGDVLPFLVLFTSKEETITTTITAVLALFAITIAVGAALLLFKCTGNRPEFRIPGMAIEIFVGMYLFRILSIGPVGFILAFIVSVAQSIVDLYPTPEDAVHEFLWVWVAVALGAGFGWLANLVLFPMPARRVLQRESVESWRKVASALTDLTGDSPATAARLLRPLVQRGPLRLLKLLKLSLLETPDLRPKLTQLTGLILALDKTVRLIYSYSARHSTHDSISSADKAIFSRLKETAEYFQREFLQGFVPSPPDSLSSPEAVEGPVSSKVIEAERTLTDLAAQSEPGHETKPSPGKKKSLFVPDAFTNPRHVQFALKVTLAGMIGYIFYTASDYFGIHTVYYTPLIIALGSTGASIHKGVLRIVGCVIGGAIGVVCTIWVIPRFETLGMFFLIVFCLHGLAAWVAFGSERISYMGLQIALAFDLGVLHDYGPPTEIDPIRDRFIGILLGICIMSIVFSLVWPESARSFLREKLAGCLRSIAQLLSLDRSPEAKLQRSGLELEIASRLSEANSYEEQADFEALLYGAGTGNGADLKDVTSAIEEIYATSLPWVRDAETAPTDGQETWLPQGAKLNPLVTAMEAGAEAIQADSSEQTAQVVLTPENAVSVTASASRDGQPVESFQELAAAVGELQVVISASLSQRN